MEKKIKNKIRELFKIRKTRKIKEVEIKSLNKIISKHS